MLAEHPIDVMLMATDLDAVKQFYGDMIGLETLIESDDFVTFRCGGASRLVVTLERARRATSIRRKRVGASLT
jgi:catechol-2,3-dioxygenase